MLVLKLRHIGDVLLATPVFRALKEAYPKGEVYACVNQGTDEVLAGNGDLAGVFLNTTNKAKSILGTLRAGSSLRKQFRAKRFDYTIDLTTSDRSALLSLLSGAGKKIGYQSRKGFFGRKYIYTKTVPSVRQEHIVLKHLRLLKPLGVEAKNPKLHMQLEEKHFRKIKELLPGGEEYFQVHAISRLAKKNWNDEFMAEAIRHIAERGWTPVLTGSPQAEEMEQVAELGKRMGNHVNLCGKLSLLDLGALSKHAKCFLGVDTAPMHIAAAAEAPVIAIFGPSSETLWAPWCKHKLVVSQQMSCRMPCKDKACKHINCLNTLTPSLVLPAIDRFLDTLPK